MNEQEKELLAKSLTLFQLYYDMIIMTINQRIESSVVQKKLIECVDDMLTLAIDTAIVYQIDCTKEE